MDFGVLHDVGGMCDRDVLYMSHYVTHQTTVREHRNLRKPLNTATILPKTPVKAAMKRWVKQKLWRGQFSNNEHVAKPKMVTVSEQEMGHLSENKDLRE